MLKLLSSFLTFGPLARLAVLLFVLLLDYVFRRAVYGRTDPVSFSLLSYSFLLVISDSFLKILQSFPPSNVPLPDRFLMVGFIYLALFFVIFILASGAHRGYQSAQEENIKTYLEGIQKQAPNTPSNVLLALERLGTSMIDPDAFEILPSKERKRVDYLKLVASVTGAEIDASMDQRKLLVGKGLTRALAQIAYVVSSVFGLAGSLYFFSAR